jgi:predicted Zn-dependent protease
MKRKFLLCLLWGALIVLTAAADGQADKNKKSSGTFTDMNVLSGDVAGALSQMDSTLESGGGLSPEDEYYLGRAVAVNILKQYRVYQSQGALTGYLNKICAALVVNSPKPVLFNGYHVLILDSPEINAFATPGGHIFLTRGIIDCADSEDTLAAVIAHELAHIQLRHAAEFIENQKTITDLTAAANRAASITARDLSPRDRAILFGESVTETVNVLMRNGYSQAQEFEADKTALLLLSRAGYDPGALVEVLQVLQKNQKGQSGGFNATHPSPDQRLLNAENALRAYQKPATRPARQGRFIKE